MTPDPPDENDSPLERLRALDRSLQSTEALLENPEFAVQLFEFSPDAIFVVDAAGTIRLANQQAELMFGYHRSELMGQTVEMLIPEGLQHAHLDHRAEYLKEPKVRPMGIGLYVGAVRKDGTIFVVEISLGPVVTRAGWFVIATIRREKTSR